MRVILVRNAEHLGEDDTKTFWAGQEVGLNPRGKRQAETACERLLSSKPASIYSSDFLRAIETIEPLASALHIEIIQLQAFRSFDVGDFFGKSQEETISLLGKDVWHEIINCPDPCKRYFPNGETLQEEANRAWTGLLDIVSKHSPDDSIVISTHLTIISCLLSRMIDLPLQRVWFWGGSMAADHPSITEVSHNQATWRLRYYGCAEHLPKR